MSLNANSVCSVCVFHGLHSKRYQRPLSSVNSFDKCRILLGHALHVPSLAAVCKAKSTSRCRKLPGTVTSSFKIRALLPSTAPCILEESKIHYQNCKHYCG